MTTKVYIEDILPQLMPELQAQGLTLCQDADSAHTSKATLTWAKKNNISLLTLPGVSPDLSILETLAHPLKRKFYSKRCTTNGAALSRFTKIFKEELDQITIQGMYN
jgi:transposase